MSHCSPFPHTFSLCQYQAWAPLAPLSLRFSSSQLAQAILVLMFCAASFICTEALREEAEHNRSPYQATACISQKNKCTWNRFFNRAPVLCKTELPSGDVGSLARCEIIVGELHLSIHTEHRKVDTSKRARLSQACYFS